MSVKAAREVADREIAAASRDSTRAILGKNRLASEPDGAEPIHVPTAEHPDWHRFYYRLEQDAAYLMIIVSTACDPPELAFCRLHANALVSVLLWSHSLSREEIVARSKVPAGGTGGAPHVAMWSIGSENLGPAEPEELVHGVLDVIEPSKAHIAALLRTPDVTGELNISMPFVPGHSLGWMLEPRTLDRISSFGLRLTFNTNLPS